MQISRYTNLHLPLVLEADGWRTVAINTMYPPLCYNKVVDYAFGAVCHALWQQHLPNGLLGQHWHQRLCISACFSSTCMLTGVSRHLLLLSSLLNG